MKTSQNDVQLININRNHIEKNSRNQEFRKRLSVPQSPSNIKPIRQYDILKTISGNKRKRLLNMQTIMKEQGTAPFLLYVRD